MTYIRIADTSFGVDGEATRNLRKEPWTEDCRGGFSGYWDNDKQRFHIITRAKNKGEGWQRSEVRLTFDQIQAIHKGLGKILKNVKMMPLPVDKSKVA